MFQILCVIVENEGDIAAFKDYTATADAPVATATPPRTLPTPASVVAPSPKPASTPSHTSAPTTDTSGHIAASPYARTLAKQKGIDLAVSSVFLV